MAPQTIEEVLAKAAAARQPAAKSTPAAPSEPAAPTAGVPGGSLIEAYVRWRDAQAMKAAEPGPDDIEAKAMKKSRKRLHKHIREGVSPAVAVVRGHQRYKELGGKSTLAVWARKIAQGA